VELLQDVQARRGLRADHRNAALGWLQILAVLAVILGVWSALISSTSGGGARAAAIFFAFVAVASLTVNRLRAVANAPIAGGRCRHGRRRRSRSSPLSSPSAAATGGLGGDYDSDDDCVPRADIGASMRVGDLI